MRRLALAALTAAMLLALAAPALAHPTRPVGPTLPADLTHASTDNVEYLGRFPEHAGTAGGRLSEDGERFYLTDPRGVFIYDVTTPEAPALLGSVPLYQQGLSVALAQEDPDTDSEILVVDGATTPFGTAALHVIDVSDPTDPKVAGSTGVTDHTWTCVSGERGGEQVGCAYVYGRTGHIVDITDIANPTRVGSWRDAIGTRGGEGYVHDLTEIRPGLVMTAGLRAALLDTSDPAKPIELSRIDFDPNRFTQFGYHSVEWMTHGEDDTLDPFVVLGTEVAPPGRTNLAGSDCEHENSVIEVWDASEIVAAMDLYEVDGDPSVFDGATWTRTDTYDASGRGLFVQGNAPGHVLYCAHWMDIHPDFDAGGLLTISYYDRGTRFVEVDEAGKMSEIGWMVPAEGYSGSSRWITDEIVYVMDYRRGMEVLRVDTGTEATGVQERQPDAILIGARYVPSSALDLDLASGFALALLGFAALGVERDRRRRLGRRG
jgi:hypothetical protein